MKEVPSLFSHRLRIEPMSRENLKSVITGTVEAYGIDMPEPEETTNLLLEQLSIFLGSFQISLMLLNLYKLLSQEKLRGKGKILQL